MRSRASGVALVHLLLAALAGAAILVWGPGTDPAKEDQRVTLPDPNPRLPALANALAIVRPPGTLVLDTTKHQQGAPLDSVMPELEAGTLDDAGAVNVKAQVTRDNGISRGVWQIAIRDSADPRQALRTADWLYQAGGWRRASGYDGVLVRYQAAPVVAYRAHYVHGPYLIRIEAYGSDSGRVDREFAELADRQLARTPPDGVSP